MRAMRRSGAAASIGNAAASNVAQAASGSVRHLKSGGGRDPAAGLRLRGSG